MRGVKRVAVEVEREIGRERGLGQLALPAGIEPVAVKRAAGGGAAV